MVLVQLLDALDRFLVQAVADGKSAHTQGQHQRFVRLLAAWTRDEGLSGDLDDLDHEPLARFLGSPCVRLSGRGTPQKASSANSMRSCLRTFFGHCRAAGYSTSDAGRLVRRARVGSPVPRGLSPEQCAALLAVLANAKGGEAQRDRVLFQLLLGTGLRLGEALGLDVGDVDLADGRLALRHVKGGGEGEAFVPVALRAELAALVGDRTGGPLFLARGGRRVSGRHIERRFTEWLAKAGVRGRFSPHSLRHSFALDLYRRTRDIALVHAALRHASITSTMVYARADSQNVREAIGAA
jgi:integrase/recombinase XerC